MFSCAQSVDPKNHQETKSDTKAKSLFNFELSWVLQPSDTVGGVGESLSYCGAGHILGVEQGGASQSSLVA